MFTEEIRKGRPVVQAQLDAGYESVSGFRDAFSKIMGAAPTNRDQQHLLFKATWLDAPFFLLGSPFQKRVWNELLKIPYGTIRSYAAQAPSIKELKATSCCRKCQWSESTSACYSLPSHY